MKKVFPVVLLFWPYLYFTFAYLDSLSASGDLVWSLAYCIATPVIYILSIVCACRITEPRILTRWNLLLKLFHIPFFLFIFLLGILFALSIWAFVFFTPVILMILVAIDVALMLTTSSFGICALIRAKKENRISLPFLLVHTIAHLFFVTDVVSSLIVHLELRKKG